MKYNTSSSFNQVLDDLRFAFRQLMHYGGKAVGIVARLPWPALLVVAIVLALVIAIAPLVIGLFLALLLVKLGVSTMRRSQSNRAG
jgi:hypothetical protein